MTAAYRLEEQLPLAAEDVVADSVEGPGKALAAAVELRPLREIVTKLEQCGVLVQAIALESDRLFLELFPGQAPPPVPRLRLASEAQKLGGLRMISADVPERACALETLRLMAARLPKDIRMVILDVRVEPSSLVLEGQARSHADAEAIAAALRRDELLTVEPPRTERLVRGGVAFALTARPARQGDAVASPASPGEGAK